MFSQTFGTAPSDWIADTAGLRFAEGSLKFGTMFVAIAAAHQWTRISPTALSWPVFILTRPLGAVAGDFLDKPVAESGLVRRCYSASATILLMLLIA